MEKDKHKILKSLKQKEVHFIKADKNNSIIVLDKTDYDNKINEMIRNGPYTLIQSSPLNHQKQKLKNTIKMVCEQLNEPKLKYKLKSENPRIPIIYATIKTHKPTQDMRPICSNVNTPYYNLSKWLMKEFNNLPPPRGLNIKNSFELVTNSPN